MVFGFKARKQKKLMDLVDQLSFPEAKARVISSWAQKSLGATLDNDLKTSRKLLTPEFREYASQLVEDHFDEISSRYREDFSYLLDDPLIHIKNCSDVDNYWGLGFAEERVKKPEEWESLFVAW